MNCSQCKLKYLLATGVYKKDNEYKCLVFPCKSCHEQDICQNEQQRGTWLYDQLVVPAIDSNSEKCTCSGQLDAFSELFSTMFKEPVTFVNVDCPVHGHKKKTRKKKNG